MVDLGNNEPYIERQNIQVGRSIKYFIFYVTSVIRDHALSNLRFSQRLPWLHSSCYVEVIRTGLLTGIYMASHMEYVFLDVDMPVLRKGIISLL